MAINFVGERLKELRFKKQIKQIELANALGVSQAQIARYEGYQNQPSYAMIKLMAEILDTSVDYLMGKNDSSLSFAEAEKDVNISGFKGDRLKMIRKIKNITQKELSEKLNINQSQISRYENDDEKPSYLKVESIADVLGVSVQYLLSEDDEFEKIPDNSLPSNITVIDKENARRIPLYTAAGAGSGKVANSDILEMVDSEIGDFGVKISGDSMIPVVEDGGIVIVEKIYSIEELKRGQMVIVRINGEEAVLKYLTVDREGGHVILSSENSEHPPRVLPIYRFKEGDCEIVGKVVEIRSRRIPSG